MKHLILYSFLINFLLISHCFSATSSDKKLKIERTIENAMQAFNVPGVAVAIVENNQLVFSQGFGIKEFGKPEKVTTDTLFGIASNTKAMTVALLAQLVDQHKISWHTKVVDILPEFQLYNTFVTQEFTLIDLLSHRSGLGYGAGDLMIWPNRHHTQEYIFKGLQHLPQTSGFRTEFSYNNLMYILAGKIIEKVTKKSWHQNIQEQLFTPIGMDNSIAGFSLLTAHLPYKNVDIAKPHLIAEDQLTTLKSDYLDNFSSAASVISNVNDMAKWLKVLLNKGELSHKVSNKSAFKLINISGDNQIYSQKQADFMWQPHISRKVSRSETQQDNTHFSAYGLGWFLKDFNGYKLVHHSGGITGMISKVLLIPEKNIGVVILTNQQSNAALNVIYREILEEYLHLPEKDWLAFYQQKEKSLLDQETKRLSKVTEGLKQAGKPIKPLHKYAQIYHDKWYGDISISLHNNKLKIEFSQTPSLKGDLIYYQDNTFIAQWNDRTLNADAYVKFTFNPNGKVSEVKLKPVSSLTDFSFNFKDLKLTPKIDLLENN